MWDAGFLPCTVTLSSTLQVVDDLVYRPHEPLGTLEGSVRHDQQLEESGGGAGSDQGNGILAVDDLVKR